MLAEINIPMCLWSMKSAFCVVGVVYLLICFVIGVRGRGGWLFLVIVAAAGLLLLEIAEPNPLKAEDGSSMLVHRVFNDKGHSVNLKSLMGVTTSGRMWSPNDDTIRGYHIDHRVFAMHDKSADCFYINPWIFHPRCLFWCPMMVCVLLGCASFLGNKK